MFELREATSLNRISHPLFSDKKVEVLIKRDDQIDEEISGNKWRKLKYNLLEAKEKGFQTILTFGGAYSNHIAATAAACRRFGFRSIGIIRGDELSHDSNPTLQKAYADGMDLQFISRGQYEKRTDPDWLISLKEEYNAFIIPEGGSNHLALKGVAEVVEEITIDFDYIVATVGTGGTLAGLISGLKKHQTALGVSSLKGDKYLYDMVVHLVSDSSSWRLIHDYHFGGYAKFNGQLIEFINRFYTETQIPLDPIYTGKMMFGLFDLIKKDKFDPKSRIICVHTGGLQGISGFNEKNNHVLKIKP